MSRTIELLLLVLLISGGPLFAQDQNANANLNRSDHDQKALFFDGIDDYAQSPFLDFKTFQDGFTVEAWIMNWSGYLLTQGAYGDPENSVWLSTGHAWASGCGWENSELNSRMDSDSINYAQFVELSRPGLWKHLAMVFDGEEQMIFVDGQLVGERLFPEPGALLNTRNLIVGAESGPTEEKPWNFGSGFLRSLRVSSVARYNSEFKPQEMLERDDHTTLLYSSNAVKGNQLIDLSGNDHHGQLLGVELLAPKTIVSRVVEGIAIDPDGKPAKGVIVLLQRNDRTVSVTKADRSGRYFFVLNNPKGEYSIEAGDWTRTIAGRWTSTMKGKVEEFKVDADCQIDVRLDATFTEKKTLSEDQEKLTAGKENPISEEALAAMEFFVGDWESETYQNGEKIGTGEGKRNWLSGKHGIRMAGSGMENGILRYNSGIGGWDANGNQIVEYWYSSDGLSAVVRYPLVGMKKDKWEGNFRVTFGDGRAFDGKCVLNMMMDGFVWVAKWKEDGKEMIRKSIARRVGVKSDMRQQSDSEKAFEAYADFVVGGVWTCSVDGQTFEDSYEHILDGQFVLLRSKGTGDFPERLTMLGVDPVTGHFGWRGFAADGSVTCTNSMTRLDDGTWCGDYHSHGPTGSERSRFRVTKVDDDTIKLEVFEQVVKGDAKAFPSLSIWKR